MEGMQGLAVGITEVEVILIMTFLNRYVSKNLKVNTFLSHWKLLY